VQQSFPGEWEGITGPGMMSGTGKWGSSGRREKHHKEREARLPRAVQGKPQEKYERKLWTNSLHEEAKAKIQKMTLAEEESEQGGGGVLWIRRRRGSSWERLGQPVIPGTSRKRMAPNGKTKCEKFVDRKLSTLPAGQE